MSTLFLIFIGSGLGGMSRYTLTKICFMFFGIHFPYAILIVNVTGSFLMGFLFVLISTKALVIAPQLTALLLVGFLGGYTTFSAFSLETLTLLEKGTPLLALLNILLSVILCIGFCYLGSVLARLVFISN